MRTKFVLISLALAATMVGCTDDELATTNANKVENQSGMIDLDENFMIGVVGVKDATTRTHWELIDNALKNVFSPIAVATGGNNQIAVNGSTAQRVDAPSIGLCWVGQSVGDAVYTNYEFFHNGWLGKDQTNAIFDLCNASVLKNGWLYSDLELTAAATNGEEAVTAAGLSSAAVTELSGIAAKVDEKDGVTSLSLADMDLNTGVYKTENKAIFGGNYIAYYPYNSDFKDAGTIPAKSEVVFADLKKNNEKDLRLAENTFRYTNVASINGGDQAKGFGFRNLSGVIRLVLKSKSNADLTQSIDKVLLYSASGAFKKQVRLSAAKINAGAVGTALYASTDETSKTILAQMESGEKLTVTANGAASFANATVYLTALPAEVSDLKVLAHDATGDKWAECTVGQIEIPAGAGKEIVASFAADDFQTVYYAVDQTTLTAAITACNAASLSSTKTAAIKVLGDIVLSAASTIPAYVTVEGDKIIVPEDQTLTIDANATIKSAVEVQGQTCCGSSTNAGAMVVEAGATVAGNVNVLAGYEGKKAGSMTFNHTASETSLVAATATIVSDGAIDFKGATDIRGTLTLNADAKATLSEATSDVNVKGGTVNNNGTFEVTAGKFAMLNASGDTEAAAGKNFKNNGTFIDNVGTTIGGATQYMEFGANGDYICKVNEQKRLNEAYANKTACSTIQFINTAAAEYDLKGAVMHNGKHVNLIDDGTAATTITNSATAAVNVGNLTNTSSSSSLTVSAGSAIQVNGDIVLNSEFKTDEDVQGMTANNLIVNKGGKATFENRNTKLGVTLAVASTIEVKADGEFTITTAASSKNIADVTCKKLVEGGTFNGKPRVIQ